MFQARNSTTPYLTMNERAVLRMLLANGRMSDVETASKLKVTPQASNKIRKKLERTKLIERYTADIDYPSIGVNLFCIASLEISPGNTEEDILKSSYGKNIIGFYRVIKNRISHFIIAGFSNLTEMDSYFHELYKEHNDSLKIRKINVFPSEKMIKCSSKDFFSTLLKDFGKEKDPLALQVYADLAEEKSKSLIKLNANERRVLSELSVDGRISYKKISSNSEDRNLTSKGVSKIKDRMEKKGVIRGYSCTLNNKKFGVNLLAVLFLKKNQYSNLENGFQKWANESKNILGCYHLNEEALHVLVCAFKNIKELENYSHEIHKLNSNLFDVEQIYVVPQEGILKDSNKDLVKSILQN